MEHPDLLVKAVLDGRPVDWDSAESTATNDRQRAQIRHFRILAAIAALHRTSESAVPEIQTKAEHWGPLRLLERIGEGSYGEVYRAWDTKLDREVALKLLRHRDTSSDDEERALEEGRLLARVRHPNVVTVFAADRIDERVGIWMEFVRGRSLEEVMRTHGALGAREAAAIGTDVCAALSAVHRAGLVHRDVKAQNVMREDGGRIVLMDFGAGREVLEGAPADLVGTPLYVAPEVFAGSPASVRSDIYSLGVLLYHLVTGSFPVKGRTVAEVRLRHQARQRSWLRDERPDLPERFIQTVERALEFDPALRYETAGAMEAALARVDSRSEPSRRAVDADDSPPSAASILSRNRRVPIVIAAASLAVVLTAGVVLVRAPWLKRPPGAAAGTALTETVRKVPLDPWRVGTPSLDGTLFSMADKSGNVAIADLQTGAVRQITHDAIRDSPGQSAEFSAISPDNRLVAYTWFALDGKCELRVVDLETGRPRVLLRSDSVDYVTPHEWSRDGKWIVIAVTRPDNSKLLALASAENGMLRPLKELGSTGAEHASISPDGQFVVYDANQRPESAARDIFIIRVDGTSERRLVEHRANDADPVWTADGRRVLFVSDRSDTTMDLWSIAVAGGLAEAEPKLVHRNVGSLWLRGLTDTGSYYYYATVGAVEVYQADVIGGVVRNPKAVPLSYAGSNISSVWSPDGTRLAYGSRRGPIGFDRASIALAVRDIQTGQQHDVLPPLKNFLLWSWAPDGRHVLAQGTQNDGATGNYLVDTETGQATAVVLNGPISQERTYAGGTFMPDGRLLYLDKTRQALFARDLQTGNDERVFDLRAEQLESPDGKYKVGPDGRTLAMSARGTSSSRIIVKVIGGGPWREVVRGQPGARVSFEDWTPDGQSLLFLKLSNTSNSLWRASINGGDPEPLGVAMEGMRDVRMNPAGTRITFTAGIPRQELWVLEHFLSR